MFLPESRVLIWLCTQPTDMHKSFKRAERPGEEHGGGKSYQR